MDPIGLGGDVTAVNTTKESTCPKMKKPACSPKTCNAPMGVPEEDGCANDGCNPFRICSTGFCCYLVEGFIDYNTSYTLARERKDVANDNRIATSVSDFWQPPE